MLSENLQFSYVEINDRLSKFVPDKVWKSQAAQRLTLNQKIELNKPSLAMQEQSMLEILEEVSDKMNKQFETAWLLDGKKIVSPLDLPNQTRIIVASTNESFQGVSGLEHFDVSRYIPTQEENRTNVGAATFVNTVTLPSIKVKP